MRPAYATIHLGHLTHNYHLICQMAQQNPVIAVIKANAYGHGLIPVGQTLYQEGCRDFAVTDAEEGTSLRAEMKTDANIILLSGLFDQNDALLCQQHQLTPVISESIQLQHLLHANFMGEVWIKVDTGMSRIGVADLNPFIKQVQDSPIHLAGIMSHLACADTPEHPLNQTQIEAFKHIQRNTNVAAYSLLNSAGIIAFSDVVTGAVRPGIALYGIEPIPSRPIGLKPVMQLSSRVLQVRPIQAGESVSYGATWSAKQDMHVAVVALGYADGLPRLLSNQSEVLHASGKLPIVGRVCMDYCLVAASEKQVHAGDEIIFFGFDDAPYVDTIAKQCQSIAYEIFTSISPRVARRYIGETL